MTPSAFRRIVPLVGAASAVLLFAARAEAAPSCTISTTSVSFGSYDVFNGSPTDTTGTVTFTCKGSAVNISVALNKGASTTFDPRTLTGGTDTLNYNLFLNSSRTTIWGDGTGGTSTYTNALPPNNSAVNVTIYARIPANQDVRAGSYSDNVTATINF